MIGRPLRTFGSRMIILAAAFVAVPAALGGQFLKAEAAKRATLLSTVQAEGRLLADGLRLGAGSASVIEMRALVNRMDTRGINMRLLLRPANDPTAVYLIATSPALPADKLAAERRQLVEAGIVDRIPPSCDGATPLDVHYTSVAHDEETLSSITPFASPAGCWAVITSHSTRDAVGAQLGRPYWQSPEVMFAAGIYGLLAVLVISMFAGLWRGLVVFARQARHIGVGGAASSFTASNTIPELHGVAEEFDRMVASLRDSAVAAKRAAEDNAHALKTPIATIAQSLEPIRRGLAEDDGRGRRSLQLVEQSVTRLDALVTAARQMDEANASLVNPPHERIDLSQVTEGMLATYEEIAAEHGVWLVREIAPLCRIWAGSELIETVIENILDNAISFAPAASTVTVRLARADGEVVLSVEDEGPGVPSDVIATMFDRYVSYRPHQSTGPGEQHFGIGLWVVRRNVESVGGRVAAENRGGGGLKMTVTLKPAK